ncbi:MAG: glycosyltransferase family 2 protein [Chloroflexi bacterium]|nr:glycosyltransferase family 2 protein [Chloroflexota bacterium]
MSIIIASRNDAHGGNTLRRTQVSLRSLLQQLEEHRIESELILVDWNPPTDRPLLKEVLQWPNHLKYCTIRIIIVPPSIHQRYEYSGKIPMHRVVAINSGIRRSRGQFVLPGAIDLIYSNELISYIAARGLKEDECYRIDRCDVDRNIIQCDTLQEQLDYCRSNIIQINDQGPPAKREKLPYLHTNAAGDFQLM